MDRFAHSCMSSHSQHKELHMVWLTDSSMDTFLSSCTHCISCLKLNLTEVLLLTINPPLEKFKLSQKFHKKTWRTNKLIWTNYLMNLNLHHQIPYFIFTELMKRAGNVNLMKKPEKTSFILKFIITRFVRFILLLSKSIINWSNHQIKNALKRTVNIILTK